MAAIVKNVGDEVVGQCRVVRGVWRRWKDGRWVAYKLGSVVEGVTKAEYEARPHQLEIDRSDLAVDFSSVLTVGPDQARALIVKATEADLGVLNELLDTEKRPDIVKFLKRRIGALEKKAK